MTGFEKTVTQMSNRPCSTSLDSFYEGPGEGLRTELKHVDLLSWHPGVKVRAIPYSASGPRISRLLVFVS